MIKIELHKTRLVSLSYNCYLYMIDFQQFFFNNYVVYFMSSSYCKFSSVFTLRACIPHQNGVSQDIKVLKYNTHTKNILKFDEIELGFT